MESKLTKTEPQPILNYYCEHYMNQNIDTVSSPAQKMFGYEQFTSQNKSNFP